MMIRILALVFGVLANHSPVFAQVLGKVTENESLVMQIIFDDCVGFILRDETPFQDLDLLPISKDGVNSIDDNIAAFGINKHLFSNRYIASWGKDSTYRFCMIQTNYASPAPMVLGVDPDGFLDRVTARAAAVGMTDHFLPETLTPFHSPLWREPWENETGEMRLSVLPTGANPDESLMDIGVIILGSGAGREDK